MFPETRKQLLQKLDRGELTFYEMRCHADYAARQWASIWQGLAGSILLLAVAYGVAFLAAEVAR